MAPLFKPAFLRELFSSISQIDQPCRTPFSHLLSSFSTPTLDEATAIKASIQESSKHEAFIEKTLHQLMYVERALQVRLHVYRKYKSDHQGMLSALRSLPPELLCKIFALCMPDDPETCSDFTLDRLPSWSIARVCQKWRYISHSIPSLWVDNIPTIDLNRNYKSGFFKLLNVVTELSFPHDLNLHLHDPKARHNKIHHFENILPRVRSLDIQHANLPLIKALAQRRESFKRLNTANISFSIASSSKRPPRLDFLSKVTCVTLSSSWDEIDDEVQGDVNDPTWYTLLRSVDFHWPNLTTFHGDLLPDFYLRKILFAAPLLQKVTMHDLISVSFELTTTPAPSAVVRHTNLKDLQLTMENFFYLSRQTLLHLHLPGLQYLQVEHGDTDQDIFASFLEQTQGSVLKLDLAGTWPLSGAFSLCPHLEELTLCFATADDVKSLTISSNSRPLSTLRCLSLHGLILIEDDEGHVLQEFLVSRGLVPFNAPHSPRNCRQLESVLLSLDCPQSELIFQRHCLKMDDTTLQIIRGLMDITSLDRPVRDLKQHLEELNNEICSLAPHLLILLENFYIIKQIKDIVDGKTSHPNDIRDRAKRLYEEWTSRVEGIRGFPRWKIMNPTGSKYQTYVLRAK